MKNIKLTLNNLFMVAKREWKHLVANKLYLFTNSISFLVQIFIYAFILGNLIPSLNYTEYYAIGMSVLTLWSFSMFTAWSVAGERQTGMIDYYLSLPIKRFEYVIGRMIGATFRNLIYVAPLLIISLLIIGIAYLPNLILIIGILVLFGFGIAGFAITLGSLVKSAMLLDFLIGIIDIFIIRLSTVYYPEYAMVFWMRIASAFNPLTHTCNILRDSTGIMEIPNIEFSIIYLIILSICITIISIKLYISKLEGGKRI
ncbi:MAG: ABC transporter permease [Candidatus Helarchaeota archaeon]